MTTTVTHSFLLEEASWSAEGVFRDRDGQSVPARAQTIIRHRAEAWINEGFMEVVSEPPLRIQNHYEIEPIAPGAMATNWRSQNPALGELTGRFVIVGNTIISCYSAVDGVHSGVEILRKLDEDHYENRGYLATRDTLVSAWEMTLTRN